MKLRTLLLGSLFALLGTTSVAAQEAGKARIGVTAGMNVTNITELKADSKLGFNAGLRVDYSFTKNAYFGTGLLWSMKGAMSSESVMGVVSSTTKLNPSYLEIPINIGGRVFLSDDLSLFAETGPYLAVGVLGKCKIDREIRGVQSNSSSDFFGDDNNQWGAKRFDAGWGLRAGVEVNHFQIHLGYEHGFAKLAEDTQCKNWNFNVGLSYMF